MPRSMIAARPLRVAAPVASPPRLVLAENMADEMSGTDPSPARDLQRRLGEAALRGFYAPSHQRPALRARRLLIVATTGIVTWAVVFGAGAAILH